MKILYPVLLLVFILSCQPKKGNNEIITLNPNKITRNEIVYDTLTSNQLDKIKIIQTTFQEVYPATLEETIDDFKRDQNPDNEIAIWLTMANAYEGFLKIKKEKVDLPRKKEAFKLILSRSMMPSDQAIENSELKILTQEEAKEILSLYKEDPHPLKVYQK
ncbi:hypothetical protein MKS83_03665 [Chryseobacterium sp. Y16C]|uniref:hypothetical protein n=1 Tax=Chryseobacterium sp. Y16C TaxID=2920939 RepID=UPI001F0B5E7F|nr:hypothetical protein [Chryseobacterium sp. Y16C]UMQ42795.1 hypothetical protein MKS83_03665 [Chryseobacterium sp. Y16C]